MCVLVTGRGHGGHVDPVHLVLHEVEVTCENGGVCVVWWDFAAFCLSLWLQKASKPSMGVQAASFPSVECVS